MLSSWQTNGTHWVRIKGHQPYQLSNLRFDEMSSSPTEKTESEKIRKKKTGVNYRTLKAQDFPDQKALRSYQTVINKE